MKVNEALTLHGNSGLSWSQVYDMIDLVGGVKGIVKAGYATRKHASAVRDKRRSIADIMFKEETHAACESAHISPSEWVRSRCSEALDCVASLMLCA